jgi:hypothetical protein
MAGGRHSVETNSVGTATRSWLSIVPLQLSARFAPLDLFERSFKPFAVCGVVHQHRDVGQDTFVAERQFLRNPRYRARTNRGDHSSDFAIVPAASITRHWDPVTEDGDPVMRFVSHRLWVFGARPAETMSSIIRLRSGVIAVVLLADSTGTCRPQELTPQAPLTPPDGERHLRQSRSVQRPLCNAYRTSHWRIDLAWKVVSSESHPCRAT